MKKNNKFLIYVLSFVLVFSLLVIPSFAQEDNTFVGSYSFNYVIDFSAIDFTNNTDVVFSVEFIYDNASYDRILFMDIDGQAKTLSFIESGTGEPMDVFTLNNDGSFVYYVSAPITIDIISYDSSDSQFVDFLTLNQFGGSDGEGLYFDLYDTLNGLIFGGDVPFWADIGLSFLALFVCLCCFIAPTAFVFWGVKLVFTSMRF